MTTLSLNMVGFCGTFALISSSVAGEFPMSGRRYHHNADHIMKRSTAHPEPGFGVTMELNHYHEGSVWIKISIEFIADFPPIFQFTLTAVMIPFDVTWALWTDNSIYIKLCVAIWDECIGMSPFARIRWRPQHWYETNGINICNWDMNASTASLQNRNGSPIP